MTTTLYVPSVEEKDPKKQNRSLQTIGAQAAKNTDVIATNSSAISGNTSAISALQTTMTGVTSGQIPGTTTNDNASAGHVGEYIEGIVGWGSGVALTNATAKTVTSITLTAGDWDVSGLIGYDPGGSPTITQVNAWISLTTNAPSSGWPTYGGNQITATVAAGASQFCTTDINRFSLAATTTIYLVAQASFSGGTLAASGKIRARRMR